MGTIEEKKRSTLIASAVNKITCQKKKKKWITYSETTMLAGTKIHITLITGHKNSVSLYVRAKFDPTTGMMVRMSTLTSRAPVIVTLASQLRYLRDCIHLDSRLAWFEQKILLIQDEVFSYIIYSVLSSIQAVLAEKICTVILTAKCHSPKPSYFGWLLRRIEYLTFPYSHSIG